MNMNFNYDFDSQLNSNDKPEPFTQRMRKAFIKKVYGILSIQLAITVLFCIISMSSLQFRKFQLENIAIFIICLVVSIVLPCVIVCFQETMRKYPQNYIILFTFTLAESYVVSFICSRTTPSIVFMAAFMTFSLVIALTLYAMTTKTDFTMEGGLIFIAGCCVFMFGFFVMFTNNKIIHIIFCLVAIALFGVYLIYDTQLIMGNKQNSLEIDDYILAAFMLYTDIVQLFLRILELIQLMFSDN
jgi:FtsH-binding integral membrane protein